MEWLVKQCEAVSRRAPTPAAVAVEASIPVHDKGKRKIVNCMEEEQSYKFQTYPLVEKASVSIEVKRKQHASESRKGRGRREEWRKQRRSCPR